MCSGYKGVFPGCWGQIESSGLAIPTILLASRYFLFRAMCAPRVCNHRRESETDRRTGSKHREAQKAAAGGLNADEEEVAARWAELQYSEFISPRNSVGFCT